MAITADKETLFERLEHLRTSGEPGYLSLLDTLTHRKCMEYTTWSFEQRKAAN